MRRAGARLASRHLRSQRSNPGPSVNLSGVRRLILGLVAATAACGACVPSVAASTSPIERVVGVYLQQAIELATVGDRPIYLTRMTSFRVCGHRGALAEDFNEHLVEVIGRRIPRVGFVAGIVNAVDRCTPRPTVRARDTGGP